jgi:hypothetical protein
MEQLWSNGAQIAFAWVRRALGTADIGFVIAE